MLMLEDISTEKRMKSTMSRYMDPGIAAQLMGSGEQEDILGGKSAVATVMFTDIRGFTPITESLGAQGTVGFLNDYFTLMVEEIAKLDGMLDKFIGDAIMAAFGLPIPHDDDEDRAVRAADHHDQRACGTGTSSASRRASFPPTWASASTPTRWCPAISARRSA